MALIQGWSPTQKALNRSLLPELLYATFCSMKGVPGRKVKKERTTDLSSLRNVLSLRTLRSISYGQVVFGKALVLVTQLHYEAHLASGIGLGS